MNITLCPNLNNPETKKEFGKLVEAIGEDNAHYVWSQNKGNPIYKTPNGKKSILFEQILSATESLTDAIRLKSQIYYNNFKRWYGDWNNEELKKSKGFIEFKEPVLDSNLMYTNTNGEKKSLFNYGSYVSDLQYENLSFSQSALKVEEGKVITYSLFKDKEKTEKIGYITLKRNKNSEYQITKSEIKEQYRNQNYGTVAYLKLAQHLAKKNSSLSSDNYYLMNKGSLALWKRFLGMGLAEYIKPYNYTNREDNKGGYYKFKNTTVKSERFYHGLPEGRTLTRQEAIAYTKRLIPNVNNSTLQFLDKLLFSKEFGNDFGVFKDGNIILAEEDGGIKEAVLRHEIFHKIYNDYLTEKERIEIRESFKKMFGSFPASELEIEEYFAKQFEYYKKDKRTVSGIFKDIIERILNFLGFVNENDLFITNLYSKIDSGSFLTREESEQRIKETKTYIIENFDSVNNFRRVRNYLINTINKLKKQNPSTNDELRQVLVPKFLANTAANLKKAIATSVITGDKLKDANYFLSMIELMTRKGNYDILYKSLYPNWNFKNKETLFEFDEINEENLSEVLGVNEYQQNDDTVDQSGKTSVVIKDFFSSVTYNGIRVNPKLLYMKTLMLLKNITGSNVGEQLEERLKDEPSSNSVNALTLLLKNLISEVENFALINENNELVQVTKKLKFVNEDTIIYNENGSDVNEKQKSSRGVTVIKRNKSRNNYESTIDFINRISLETNISVPDINNAFYYFQKSNTLSELMSHFSSQSEKEFFVAEEKRIPGRGIGYTYHGIAANDSGTAYKREIRAAFSKIFDINPFIKGNKLVKFNIDSFINRKFPKEIIEGLNSNNINIKRKSIKGVLSVLNLKRYHENIDNFNNEQELSLLSNNLYQFLTERIKQLGLKKTQYNKGVSKEKPSDSEIVDISNEVENEVTGSYLYNTIDDILDQENNTLNLFRNILNQTSEYLRPSSVSNMDGNKVFLFNNSSTGKTILDILAANWSKKRNIPEYLKTEFFSENIFNNINNIFKVVTHDGLKSDFSNVPYKNESDTRWLSRVLNYSFISSIGEQSSIKTDTNLKYINFTYTPSNRPTIMGARINLLKENEIQKAIEQALIQLTKRPKDTAIGGYNRNSTVNIEIIKEVLGKDFKVEMLEKMNSSKIQETAFLIRQKMNEKANKLLEYLLNSEFQFDANINKTLENLHLRGYIKKPEYLPKQFIYKNGVKQLNPDFDINVLRDAIQVFYANNYINSYFLNQLIVGDFAYFKNSLDIIKRLQGVLAPGKKPYINPNFGLKETFKAAIIEDNKVDKNSIKDFLSKFIKEENELKKLLSLFPAKYESTDAQGFMLPERRDALEVGMGTSYKIGNILKPAHYENRVIDGNPVPIMLKYSSIVLSDELVKTFPGLEKLRDNMRNSEVEEVVFKSGTKTGAPKKLNSIDDSFNKDYNFTDILELSNDFYRLQLNPAHEIDSTVATPTQLSYFLQILSKNINNAKNLYSALSSLINIGLAEFKEKTNSYDKLKKLAEQLTEGSGSEIVNELLKEGISLDFPAISQKIISSVSSKLTKETVGIRLKGSKLVLQSDIGIYKSENSSRQLSEERKKLIKNQESLQYVYDDKRMYAEVMLPLQFKKYINKGDFLMHADLLGFRIPSSELHSAVPLKIVGFYDAGLLEMDNVIIAPKELVPLHGSDFDVDALYVIRREYATKKYTKASPEKQKLIKEKKEVEISLKEKIQNDEISVIDSQRLEEEYLNSKDRVNNIEFYGDNFDEEISRKGWVIRNYPDEFMWYQNSWNKYFVEFKEIESLIKQINSIKTDVITEKGNPIGYIKNKDNVFVLNKELEQDILETEDNALITAYYKNIILDSFLEAITSERNFDRMFSPISTEEIKSEENPNSLFNYIKNTLKITDVFIDNLDASDILDSLRIYKSSMEGSKLTGVFADLIKVFSYLSKSNIDNNPSDIKDINLVINNNAIKELKDNETIWRLLDSLLNSAIDNVKEQILPVLNINSKNVNLFSLLLASGVDIKTLTALNLTPIMRYISSQNGNMIIIAKSLRKELIGDLYYEYNKEDEISLTKEDFESLIKIFENEEINKSNIIETYFENTEAIDILDLIIRTEPYTNQLSDFSNLIGIIKNLPAKFHEIESLMDIYKGLQLDNKENKESIQILTKEEKIKFDITNLYKNNPHLLSALKTLEYLHELLSSNIKIYNPKITSFLKQIRIPNFEGNNEYQNRNIVRFEFIKFLASSFYDFSNEPEIENTKGIILNGIDAWNEKFMNKVSVLKSEYKTNTFLDGLSIKSTRDKGNIITSNNTNLEYEDIVERKEDFKKLPIELQKEFVKYAAINYGFKFGASNYSLLLPSELVKEVDEKINNSLDYLLKNEDRLNELKDSFQIQLYLNFAEDIRHSSIEIKNGTSLIEENKELFSNSLSFDNKKEGDIMKVSNFPEYMIRRYDETKPNPVLGDLDPIYTGKYIYVVYKRLNNPYDPVVYYTRVGNQNRSESYKLTEEIYEKGYNVEDKFRTDIVHVKFPSFEQNTITLTKEQAEILNYNLKRDNNNPLKIHNGIIRASLYSDKVRNNIKHFNVVLHKGETEYEANKKYNLHVATNKEISTIEIKVKPTIIGLKETKRKKKNAISNITEESPLFQEIKDTMDPIQPGRKRIYKSSAYELTEVVKRIIKDNTNPRYTKLLSFLIDNLGKDSFKNGRVFFVSNEKMKQITGKNNVGGFNGKNIIYINIDIENSELDKTFVHELVHYFTAELLSKPNYLLTKEQRLAKENLKKLYQSVLNFINSDFTKEQIESPENFYIKYAMKNIDEFVAQALSDPDFQNYLYKFDAVRNKQKSIMHQFIDLIKDFLGLGKLSKNSALTAVFNEVIILSKDYVNPYTNQDITDVRLKKLTVNYKFNKFTSNNVKIEDVKKDGNNFKVNPKDENTYINELTNKLYGRISDNVKGLSALVTGIKQNFKFNTAGEAAAYKFWDKYNIDPNTPLSTDILSGSKVTKQEYIDIKNTLIEDAKTKGNILHKFIDAMIKQTTGKVEEGNKIIEEINKIIIDNNLNSFIYRYNWIAETNEKTNKRNNLIKLLENVGINTLTDGVQEIHKDKLESEIIVSSDILGFAGTIDLLAQGYDGKYSIVDWKTGANFDGSSVANRLFQFGNQQNDLLDTSRNRAKLQVMLYALMLKLKNPDVQFRSLHAYWVNSERQAKNGDPKSEVEVRDFLDMIESFFKQEGVYDEKTGKTYKEVYEEMLKASPNIFKPSEYIGTSSSFGVEKDLTGKEDNELLDYYRNKLNVIINSVPDKKNYTKRQKEQIKEYTQKILELEKNPNTQFNETGDISGFTRWLGNLDDTSSGYIKTYKKILDQDREIAAKEYRIKQQKFNRLLRPILEDYLGKKGMLVTDRLFRSSLNNVNTEKFWGKFYKEYKRDDITYRGLITQSETEWNSLNQNEKEFLLYVQSEFKSLFKGKNNLWDRPAVTDSEYYHEGMTVGQLYNYTKKSKFNYDEFGESFVPTVPTTTEEIRERYGIFSKENWEFIKSRSLTLFYEDQYENEMDDTEAIPFKYLGTEYLRNTGTHSINLEKIFDRFMTNSINKKHLDHTFAIGKGLQVYLNMKAGDNKDMYKNTVDLIEDKLLLDVLNRKKNFKFTRKGFKIGKRKDIHGNEYIQYLDINQLLRSLKSFISLPTMWLKPIQGSRNAVFISMLNVKEAVKGSIADTGIFGIDGNEIDFTVSDLTFAANEWRKMQGDFILNRHRKNKMWLLLKEFRYLPDNYDWATNNSDLLTQKNKIISESTMYLFHSIPEEWHAGMIMVAQLHRMKNNKTGKSIYDSYKVTEVNALDNNNNIISSDDYHQKEFKIEWDGSIRGVIQTSSNEYKEIKELDAQEINKLKRVYTTMHGGYRREERVALEAYVFGELFLQFKKYLPAVLKNAFRSKGTDSSLGYYKYIGKKKNGEEVMEWIERMNEGRWRLLGRVMLSYLTLKSFNYSELSSQQKLQLLDATITISTWMVMLGLWHKYFDDEDDKNSYKKLVKHIIDNYSQQYNPSDIGRNLLTMPTSITKSYKGMTNLVDMFLSSSYYLIGDEENALTNRGDLKGLNEVKRTTPIVASYYDIIKFIEGDEELEEKLLR